MNKKMKVMTILGTRPEIIKMSETMKLFDKVFDHVIVHTGQNYDFELNQIFYDDLGLRKPDFYLDVVGSNLGETIGNVISKSYKIIQTIKPDALVLLGDTNSCLAAIAAKRLKVPVFHLEAGNRCFDENLPEEVNRRIVDITSDVNLCYSEYARRNLLLMGSNPACTFCIGSPMPEILDAHINKINDSQICEKLSIEPKKFFLLSAHREENVDNLVNFSNMVEAINGLAEEYSLPILYSLHPRTRKLIEQRNTVLHPLVRAHKPFGFTDYIKLQLEALCVISDSGTLAEESSYLNFPAVSLRTSTERQEVIDAGVFTLGMLNPVSLIQAVELEISLKNEKSKVIDYRDRNVSSKIAKIVQSYTDYVNSNVWRKGKGIN